MMFDENAGGGGRGPSHAEALNVLARAEPAGLKALAENLLESLGDIEVLGNRTGLVMVPMRDTVENVDFHLGEVLVSEAHITDAAGAIGYGESQTRALAERSNDPLPTESFLGKRVAVRSKIHAASGTDATENNPTTRNAGQKSASTMVAWPCR